MDPATHAHNRPDHPAVLMAGTGEVVTYTQLDAGANRFAHALRNLGVGRGDHVAILAENHPRYFEVLWGALRSGTYLTPVNRHLAPKEIAYVLRDSGAVVLVTTPALLPRANAALDHVGRDIPGRLVIGSEAAPSFDPYDDLVSPCPATPVDDESMGSTMLYTSGTTGAPKGVRRPLPDGPVATGDEPTFGRIAERYGFGPDTVYLSPAPLYHAAPLAFSRFVQRAGGTVVVLERFDASEALRAIERHRVTHSQWVPTMFVRMLRLPDDERRRYDLAGHEVAVHAGAPCPVWVKRAMIDWWGPILYEYYSSTEGIGSTSITSEEWLGHPGSVGRPDTGCIHVLDEDGRELPPFEIGTIYFSGGAAFEYHGGTPVDRGTVSDLRTVGDVGYVDDEGRLYLTDRKSFTIVSGGVNIYSREVEDVLLEHPSVADVAVFGVPDDDFGEAVKAVVEAATSVVPGPQLADELVAFARARLATFKCPRSIDFVDELPRLPTGKLAKAELRESYWRGHATRIV